MDFKRVFIEKKEIGSTEKKELLREFRDYLNIQNLQDVRVVNIYDLIDVDEEESKQVIQQVLYEPILDLIYDKPPIERDEKAFRIKYQTGQYNQTQDSALEFSNKFVLHRDIDIVHTKMIILKGIDEEDLKKIKSYYINPLEMEEIEIDTFIYEKQEDTDEEVEILNGFIQLDEKEMKKFKDIYGIGMDIEDLIHCRDYFKKEDRDPTIAEVKLIDTYWSDHCRHTTFMTKINNIELEDGMYKKVFEDSIKEYLNSRSFVYKDREKAISLMDLAVINMKEVEKKGLLEDKEDSKEVNAASIEIDVDVDGKVEKWLLMFKNETHNHPTEMEPFGGASTCLGGAIRDPLSGRSFVYQAMRITGAADPRESFEDTIEGKLPQRKITKTAMKGYSSYGNQIGAATGYVREIYDDGFKAKRMECGALVAAAPKDWVYRGEAEPEDVVVLVGGRTGRDGLGGAVGSSVEHSEDAQDKFGAQVQKGNPPLERKILRLFRNKKVSKMIKICNDFGAGGVGVAIGELADGLEIDLDKVPLKYPGLDGMEIALSESQERMAVVIDKENLDEFLKEALNEDLEATVVAHVTEEKTLKMNWRNREIVNIKREFLDTNGIRKETDIKVMQPEEKGFFQRKAEGDLETAFIDNLKNINIGSQKSLVENFDNTVGAGTVLMPYGGKYLLSPSEGMVAKIPVLDGNTSTCSIMTYGYEPEISKWSPYHGGYFSVIDSLARITALGGDYRKARLSFQEYFERLGEDKSKWGKPFAALLGAFIVEKELDIPSIGGKDSMSGTFEDIDVPPTLISFAVTSEKVENIISSEFKESNRDVVIVNLDIDEKNLVDLKELKKNFNKIKELIDENKVSAAMSVKLGGIARALSEMSFGNKIGFKFNEIEKDELFKAKFGSIILELKEGVDLEESFKDINYKLLGKTTDEKTIEINKIKMDIDELIKTWESPLEEVFEKNEKNLKENIEVSIDGKKLNTNKKHKNPKVLIPIFTGTHGEYSMGEKFKEAGADVEYFVFNTQNREKIEESFEKLAEKISDSQIIGLAHGAVLGNEPETGGKFVSFILNNPHIKDAINYHLKQDGLILGIGDGFSALLKAGLIENNGFYITKNESGGFVSTISHIKVVSNNSPWIDEMEVGDIYSAPVATYEGKVVVIDKDDIDKSQIASVFTDQNPTGSDYNIESLTSKDGRVLGTISSIDRMGKDLYKNVDIRDTHNIFKAGVNYFK